MLKIDRQDANERGFTSANQPMIWVYPDGIEMDTPQRLPQKNYVANYFSNFYSVLISSSYTNPTTGYAAWIDVDSWIDHNLLGTLTLNADWLRLSGYFYKNRNKKIEMGPIWDHDRAEGTGDAANNDFRAYSPRTWIGGAPLGGGTDYGTDFFNANSVFPNPWFLRLFMDANFWQKWIDRYQGLRPTALATTNILAFIDAQAAEVRRAQVREVARWGGNGNSDTRPRNGTVFYVGSGLRAPYTNVFNGTFQGEVDFQKKWYTERLNFIDTNFLNRPTFASAGGQVSAGSSVILTDTSGKAGTILYYTLDGSDPRALGGAVAANALTYSGPVVVNNNVRIVARAFNTNHRNLTGANNPPLSSPWSGPIAQTYYTMLPPLRITEIMYHPARPPAGNTNDPDAFEFIELKNISGSPLNLNGFQLSGGVTFTFSSLNLSAGQSVVVVKDLAAFQSRYGTNNPNILIAGVYTNGLNNAGDHLVLTGPLGEPILDFNYSDEWFRLTDGTGFSLVTADESGMPAAWNTASGWRVSSALGGSPGRTDPPAPPRPPILVNEALTHTDPPAVDVVELYNPTAMDVSLAGWFLSDDFNDPKKYVIPSRTITAHGYATFNESDFNPGGHGFAFSAKGDAVYLFSGDGTNLTGYAQGFDFGAAANGVSFGRYVISTGEDHFVAQKQNTLGATNAGPLVGPIIISEIMYHPPDAVYLGHPYNNTLDEYVELRNIGATDVKLFDEAHPANTWHLSDAVEYSFPTNTTLAHGGFLLVVGFDPIADPGSLAAFRAHNFVPDTVPIYGPWHGDLDNARDSVELRRPDLPETNTLDVPYILVERVKYSDMAPWPTSADGTGLSLQRIVPTDYGNDPTNYVAAGPTPGSAMAGGIPPAIVSQPSDQLLVTGRDAMFNVTATGTAPLRYQWRFNGLNILNATNSILLLTNVQPDQAGVYNIFVYNGGGSTSGTNFTITTRIGLQIVTQPPNRVAQLGQTTNFTVVAVGTGPLHYQWRFNGNNIANATSNSYTVSNIQSNNAGTYTVQISDDFDVTVSQPATLTLIFKPSLTIQPLSISVVSNGTATFSAAASGTTPISFRWRKNNITISNPMVALGPSNSTLILPHVTLADAGTYNVAVTNIAGAATGLSSNAVLIVLADSDGDGIPDDLEPVDGAADTDGDGMSNAAEYFAGTDYLDRNSYLRIDIATTSGTTLRFSAVSNHTYTVQYTDGLNPLLWKKLTDVLAAETTRMQVLSDNNAGTNRYYRVVTPVQPVGGAGVGLRMSKLSLATEDLSCFFRSACVRSYTSP
jgi:hypothetical protein